MNETKLYIKIILAVLSFLIFCGSIYFVAIGKISLIPVLLFFCFFTTVAIKISENKKYWGHYTLPSKQKINTYNFCILTPYSKNEVLQRLSIVNVNDKIQCVLLNITENRFEVELSEIFDEVVSDFHSVFEITAQRLNKNTLLRVKHLYTKNSLFNITALSEILIDEFFTAKLDAQLYSEPENSPPPRGEGES